MRKSLIASMFLALAFYTSQGPTLAASLYKYTCYRYVNNKPTGGWIYVKAYSKPQAERIAYERFKKLGGRVDYAKCRY